MLDNSGKERRFIAMREVMHAEIAITSKLVYYEIDDRAGYKPSSWPKQSTIADALKISLRAVNDGIQELRDRGFISVAKRGKGIEYFPAWSNAQRLRRTVPERAQNLHLTGPVSMYEQQKEQRNEQRCSACGGSGWAGNSGADLRPCECPAGEPLRKMA